MTRKRKPRDIGYDNMTDVQKAFYDGYDEGYLAGSSPAAGGQEQAVLEALKMLTRVTDQVTTRLELEDSERLIAIEMRAAVKVARATIEESEGTSTP